MKFKDIPQFPFSSYHADIPFTSLRETLERWDADTDPSYQRGLVWTQEQRERYIEYLLRGGRSGREIYFNSPTWMDSFKDRPELWDGKQRLNACIDFTENKLKAFGLFCDEYEDTLRYTDHCLSFHVFKIKDRAELIQTYIKFNKGGSIHTEKDLEPAYKELEKLTKK